tara:strand:+ start:2224 stop:3111 length:888 start_codon:yes stop_codon:yes gene_type:complete
MKILLIISLSFLFAESVLGQNDSGVKSTVTLSGKDTLVLKKFDQNKNLVFHKIFPQYGISQILGWSYSDNKVQTYTWSHSNIGFVETEYEYDSSGTVVNLYTYETDGHSPPDDLMSFHSVNDLKNSKEFKEYVNGYRILKSTQFFNDDLLFKEIKYNSEASIDTFIYSYKNGYLISKKFTNKVNSYPYEIIYEYDSKGNEIQWMKVFRSSDTTVVYSKTYEDGKLIEVKAIEKGELTSIETFNYWKGKLSSTQKVNKDGIEKMSSQITYRKDGRIDYIDEINKYLGQKKRTYYYY